jgi:hypothetical protein
VASGAVNGFFAPLEPPWAILMAARAEYAKTADVDIRDLDKVYVFYLTISIG